MTHVVSGKIRKEPFIKQGVGQDGSSTMYIIELSEMIKEWNSDEKHYSNYKAMFFAKTQAANDFYSRAFAEGSFAVVACEKLKVETREHDGKTFVTLLMENPRLEGVMPVSEQSQNTGWQQPQQQQPYQQPQQQQQRPQTQSDPYDYDMPF